jgi:hypothetical protein
MYYQTIQCELCINVRFQVAIPSWTRVGDTCNIYIKRIIVGVIHSRDYKYIHIFMIFNRVLI